MSFIQIDIAAFKAHDERGIGELVRFWQKVVVPRHDARNDPCWSWTGSVDGKGYGLFRRTAGPSSRAHRIAWEMLNGEIPEGLVICHKCDNPKCVRPSHLFLGTVADNNADREAKGRGVRQHGESHPLAKLSVDLAEKIRADYAKRPDRQRDIAARYGVSQHAVWRVLNSLSWVPE